MEKSDMDTSLFYGDLVQSSRILYTPSPFAKANLIYLQETGTLKALAPHVSQREKLSSYLFFLIRKGSGIVTYAGKNYSVKEGDCIFIDCQKPYSHCSSDELWELQWVHFYGANMAGIYEKYKQRGGKPCFSTEHSEKPHGILKEIFEIANSDIYIRDMKIYEKLVSLLSFLMEESWQPELATAKSHPQRNLQPVKDYLDKNFCEKICLDELSQLFYINNFYLTRLFREQYGMPISKYLMQLRITKAKQLLRFTELSIEEVGNRCGMRDASYFARVFKKVEGIGPGGFREMWRQRGDGAS